MKHKYNFNQYLSEKERGGGVTEGKEKERDNGSLRSLGTLHFIEAPKELKVKMKFSRRGGAIFSLPGG